MYLPTEGGGQYMWGQEGMMRSGGKDSRDRQMMEVLLYQVEEFNLYPMDNRE